jgi:hypothetical protein
MIPEKMLELLALSAVLDDPKNVTIEDYDQIFERFRLVRDEFIKEQLQYPIIKNPVTDTKSDECS